jgi:DNA polymerase elongation subunit (family B)
MINYSLGDTYLTPNLLALMENKWRRDSGTTVSVMAQDQTSLCQSMKDNIEVAMAGDIQLQDLIVSKLLGQGLDKYKSLFPHVSAAIQLANEGKSTIIGDGIEYIYTNARHSNPLCRVTPAGYYTFCTS